MSQTEAQQPGPAVSSPHGDGPPRWHAIAVLLAIWAAVWIPAVLLVSGWVLMELEYAAHFVSGFAIICLGLGVLAHVVAHLKHRAQHEEVSGHQKPPPRLGRARYWLGVFGAAGLGIGGETATHWGATEVHHHIENRFPGVQELYANHDIARLPDGDSRRRRCAETLDAIEKMSREAELEANIANPPQVPANPK